MVKPPQNRGAPLKSTLQKDTGGETTKFHSTNQISKALEVTDVLQLKDSLQSLRNQFTVKANESPINPLDGRLLLAKAFVEQNPGLPNLCNLFAIYPSNFDILSLTLAILSNTLNLLSSHPDGHPSAASLIKALFAPPLQRRFRNYLDGAQNDLILGSLKLYIALSSFAGGREQKHVLENFPWTIKSLPKLMFMRRKGKVSDNTNMLLRPDIRTLYIQFLLPFLSINSSTSIKTSFLESHRDTFISIFKGIPQDPYSVARHILETCWTGIWSDPKLSRSLKIGAFQEHVFQQLLKLYQRTTPEDPADPESIPADLAHHFILGLTTKPGFGICFKDRGWYPRETDVVDEEAEEGKKAGKGKIYNKILSNILKLLKINEDPRQNELALRILQACPELVAGYWQSAGLTLEPRLASKWLTNIAFVGSVISSPVPEASFRIATSMHASASSSREDPLMDYNPMPPPLHAITENVLPGSLTRVFLSKGLQHTSALVQHMTAILLIKSLTKLEKIAELLRRISSILQEDEERGLWRHRAHALEQDILRRLPDYRSIVNFAQNSQTISFVDEPRDGDAGASAKAKQPATPRDAETLDVLSEAALRLLSLYQRCLPDAAAEVKFDSGKLLTLLDGVSVGEGQSEGYSRLRRLHLLRLLKNDPQFVWSNKAGGSSFSHLGQLLLLVRKSRSKILRQSASTAVESLLSQTSLFEHDPDEISIWMEAFPLLSGPDLPPMDPSDSNSNMDPVISFLDNSLQRCLKTPYRYLEENIRFSRTWLVDGEDGSYSHSQLPSPLFMTILKQLTAAMRHMATRHDLPFLFAYVRRLTLLFLGKQPDLQFAKSIVDRLRSLITPGEDESDDIRACERQIDLLASYIRNIQGSYSSLSGGMPMDDANAAITSETLEKIVANPYSFVQHPQTLVADGRFATRHPKGPDVLIEILSPHEISLADLRTDVLNSLEKSTIFEVAIALADDFSFQNSKVPHLLLRTCFKQPLDLPHLRRRLNLLCHRLPKPNLDAISSQLTCALLSLLQTIVVTAMEYSKEISQGVKTFLFEEVPTLQDLLTAEHEPPALQLAIQSFVESSLSTESMFDCALAASYSTAWLKRLVSEKAPQCAMSCARCWIPFMNSTDLLHLLSNVLPSLSQRTGSQVLPEENLFMDTLFKSLIGRVHEEEVLSTALQHIKALLQHSQAFSSPVLGTLLGTVISRTVPSWVDGLADTPISQSTSDDTKWTVSVAQIPAEVALDIWSHIPDWTESRDRMLSHAMYTSSQLRERYAAWLRVENRFSTLGNQMVHSFHTFVDVNLSHSELVLSAEELQDYLSWSLKLFESHNIKESISSVHRSTCSILFRLMRRLPTFTPQLLISKLRITNLKNPRSIRFLLVGLESAGVAKSDGWMELTSSVTEQGLLILTRLFGDNSNANERQALSSSINTHAEVLQLRAHVAEPFLQSLVQSQLDSSHALTLGASVVASATIKPASVNKVLQSVINNPRFELIASSSSRDSLVDFIDSLFRKHPQNSCQLSHVVRLLPIYGGSLLESDQRLFAIMKLFERERRTSITSLLSTWTPSRSGAQKHAESITDVLLSLEPQTIFRSCHHIYTLSGNGNGSDSTELAYDPHLLLGFVGQLAHCRELKALEWVELFRSNIFSFVICCFSAKDRTIRTTARVVLATVLQSLRTVDFQEKQQATYLFEMVRGSQPSSIEGSRLPSYLTLFLAHALRGVFYPAGFSYPHTARHLLQRPELDLTDVPMFLGMIFSSSDDWKRDRIWMLRLVRDGLKSNADWKIFRRRHIFEYLVAYLDASEISSPTRTTILEIILEIVGRSSAATTFIVRHAWLSWVEMQLVQLPIKEEVGIWAQILSKMVSQLDLELVDKLAGHSWRLDTIRCLHLLIDRQTSLQDLHHLSEALSLLCANTCYDAVAECLDAAVQSLSSLEESLQITTSQSSSVQQEAWSNIVVQLWRVSMMLPKAGVAWESLTSRLLYWRSASRQYSGVGEWVRQQVVYSLSLPSE